MVMEVIRDGGWVMYAIILCSVIALGFIIERFIVFRQCHCNMQTFFPLLENSIKLGKTEEAMVHCEKANGLIPKVFLVGLKNKDENMDDLRRMLIDEIQIHVLPTLEKYLGLLATIAKGAPMLGLLGTVLGMMVMFQVIGKEGFGDPQKLAGALRLAIGTTVAGLLVAIPIIFVHAYFKGQIRNFELDLYHYLTRFLRLMRKRQEVSKANGQTNP